VQEERLVSTQDMATFTNSQGANYGLLSGITSREVPAGYTFLLTGLPGVGKTAFVKQVFKDSVAVSRKGIYVALEPPRRADLELWSSDEAKVIYVDGYSWKAGLSPSKYSVKNLSNLNELSIKLMDAASELGRNFFYVVDSLSNLAIYSSENEILRFIEVVVSRFRHSGAVGVWVSEDGIQSSSFYNTMRHIMDGVIEMKAVDGEKNLRRFMRCNILRALEHSTEWLEFSISQKGLLVGYNGTNMMKNKIHEEGSL